MDSYSPIGALLSLVGAIVFLRVFFTFWGPIDRKLNSKLSEVKEISISELKGVPLSVRFTSGVVLENVILEGHCASNSDEIYELNRMLVLRGRDGKQYFARASEIEYLEQTSATTSPILPPTVPPAAPGTAPRIALGPDEPESWR